MVRLPRILYNEAMRNEKPKRVYPVARILQRTLILAIPVVLLFIIVSSISFSEIRNQNNLAIENAVHIYQTELEHKLDAISHFVQWTVVHDPILDAFDSSHHMGDFRKASDDLRLRVSDMQYAIGEEYQYFFYWDEKNVFFNASTLAVDYDTYKTLRSLIISEVANLDTPEEGYHWFPLQIKDRTYLCYRITYKHRTFVSLVSIEKLLSPLSTLPLGKYGSIQVDSLDGEPFYQTTSGVTGLANLYYENLVFSGEQANLPFTLVIETDIFRNYGRLFFLQFLVFLTALTLTTLMGSYVLITYRRVILPIRIFSANLSRMNSVDENMKAAPLDLTDSRLQELNQINDQFKNLIHEITRLRIDIYEAELNKNKFQIHFLQQQIKPHFYLNCLTTIDSMVQLGEIDAAKKMLQFTSTYFRYLFQADQEYVPLRNELSHVEAYMNIQGMRLSETIRYESQVDAGLEDAPIPPLLLITFIENTIKHATPPSGVLQVFVSCTSTLKEDEKALFDQGIRIEITDNGQGFPEDVLQHLQGGIGIANCIQRLHLLYGEHYRIHLDNAPEGGARITLLLPTQR